MPINIQEDLNINVTIISSKTQTINNIYDTGNPPGTYLPGKDFSPTDDVSTGIVTAYNIGIALSSKTNQTYPIDKLFLQSIDDPKTNGTGKIPFYWINTNPNPQDITDDNQYTLVPNYNANMSSVVFDQNAGVTSASTVNLTLYVNYPNGLYWKSKIAPKIVAVALKDGIEQKSPQINPMEVRMSSTADIQNDFFRLASEWSGIRLTTKNGVKGFDVPFYMQTSELPLPEINTLLDSPNATTISYTGDLAFTIDGANIPITQQNIATSLQSGTGVAIQSATISGNKYTIVLERTSNNITFPITLRSVIFLPYDPGSKANVTMTMNGVWDTAGGVVWDNWTNNYIFSETTIGGINASQVIPLTFTNPARLSNQVSSYIQPPNTSITSSFDFNNLNFISIAGSKMMLLYDSQVSYISNAAPYLQVAYMKLGETSFSYYTPPTGDYIQQYGYVALPTGYNANTLCQSVLNGNVTLDTYENIVASGHTPNILMTTILNDVLASLNVDYSQPVSISYQQAQTDIISNTDFMTMYQNNPSGNFTSYLYTSMLIGTNLASVATANAQYGTSIAPSDQFVNVSGKVFLDLSTVTKGQPGILFRFNVASVVRSDIPIPKYNINLQTSITDNSLNTITSIADYSQTYNLNLFVQSPFVSSSVLGTFLAGTTINFAIPSNILPYIYLAGNPGTYKMDPNYQLPVLIDNITNYSLSSSGISIVLPKDITFYNNITSAVYLSIPVKFLLPAQNQVFSHQNTAFDLSKLILSYPNQLVTGFGANTPYFTANMKYANSTLQGAGVDFTGLTVNKNYYENGTSVDYIATVKNSSNVSDNLYMALTVPTNEYNPLETSNNAQPAFINNIATFYPTTTLYYQTASKATAADITAMKEINQPGTNLSVYYNTVIVNNWTLYHNGDVLPSDVVMMVAYSPNVAQGDIVRVDYNVKVEMDINTTQTYINDAAFNYYSSSSTLETQSNKVTIQNYKLVNDIVITKSPANQNVEGITGGTATFTIVFDVPTIASAYQSLTLTDQLPKALTLLSTSTLQIGNNTPVPLNATMSPDKLVTFAFTNMAEIAGKTVTITLMTKVDQPQNIPVTKLDTNQASLIINSNPALVSNSNIVDITYYYNNIFNINKQPISQSHPKTQGELVEFQIFFDVPQDVSGITDMVITDVLDPSLSYDPTNSLLQIGTISVEPLNATVSNNTITVDFSQFAQAAGKTVKITLGTILTDLNALPLSGIVENAATLTINDTPAYSFVSNTVEAKFGVQIMPIPIVKAPVNQTVEKAVGVKVPFELSFTLPNPITGYNKVTVTDTLDASLLYLAADSTIQIGTGAPTPLNANVSGSTITKELNSLTGLDGEKVVITLVGIVNDLTKIPSSNEITNFATLVVNHDATLSSTSNDVTVIFKPVIVAIPIVKAPVSQTVEKAVGIKVPFELSFTLPNPITGYNKVTVTDTLDASLLYLAADSTIQIGTSAPTPLNANVSGSTITKELNSLTGLDGEKVVITLVGIVNDLTKIPSSNEITNFATLVVNHDATLSSTSNDVTVIFKPVIVAIPIVKAPVSQTVEKAVGIKVPFELSFTLPNPITGYNKVTVTDTLDASLLYSAADSTIQIGTGAPTPLNANVSGNTITKELNSLTGLDGEKVVITLVGIVNDLTKIPSSNEIINFATLVVNHDATLSSTSNDVTVIFKPVIEQNPIKTSNTTSFNITQDKTINFNVTFFSELVKNQNMTIVIEDVIDSNLQIVSYSLDIVDTPNISIIDKTVGNSIKYEITTMYPTGSALLFPPMFHLDIVTKYVANTIINENYIINNFATIRFGETGILLNSNTVQIEAIGNRKQAINDIIESVALEQTALSHILNAEGEKLQKIIGMPNISSDIILKANDSVKSMINTVSSLEMILSTKLDLFDCIKCD